jgi:NAD+ synthase (glutamine-hydrolysing)
MKVALAQINSIIGDFEYNKNKIRDFITNSQKAGADLVVFPELSVCGYPPQDFLEFDDFLEQCNQTVADIAAHCHGIACVIGAPTHNPHPEGKNLFNSAYFIDNGAVTHVAHKSLLPTYDIFDEYRYFESNKEFEVVNFKGKKIGLTICEDIWDIDDDPLYTISPLKELAKQQPDLIINISASPFSYDHAEKRKNVLRYWSQKLCLPIIYVNYSGAQTELIFDGGSMLCSPEGEIREECAYFSEELRVVQPFDSTPRNLSQEFPKSKRIYNALVFGVREYFEKNGFSKAVVGMSGGIDSALTMVIAAEALGAQNVHGLLMPSMYSSDHSIADAIQSCQNLGVSYDIISIEELYKSFEHALHPLFHNTEFGLAEENLQARIRGNLLMAYSNKFNHILLNTSNKSENAVGYGTLYGDMCGGLSVIGDVYKTEVYEICRFINQREEIIPQNSITKAPSAELRPNQKDSDSLPDYEILDKILYLYIELRKSPSQIIAAGFEKNLVLRILKMVNRVEYKRKQTAPILRVSNKAFGHGRRLPIVGKYLC